MEVQQKNVLFDILEGKKNESRQTSNIFKRYRKKEEIGKNIFAKLEKYSNKEGLFYLSESNNSVGIITISQAIISLAYLSQYGVHANDITRFKTLLEKNVTALFSELKYSAGCNELEFTVSPYAGLAENGTKNYVDSAAKVLQALMELREMLYLAIEAKKPYNINIEGIGGDDEVLAVVTKCVKITLRTLAKLAIPCEPRKITYETENETIEIISKYKGWNYTNIPYEEGNIARFANVEPSLYFTYAVAIAYMSVYENINDVLTYVRQINEIKKDTEHQYARIREEYGSVGNDPEKLEEFAAESKKISINHDEAIKSVKMSDNMDKFNRDKKFYDEIINDYANFRSVMKSVGYYLDNKINDVDLKTNFIGLDYNKIDFNEIKGSTTNNAVFNVLFTIVILISSGVADDYEEYNPSERYFEWLQSAIQNVYDSYCDLEKMKKLYIVEQYILNFNESLPDEMFEEANLLRKQRIQVLSLVPLMVRTYNLVSQYLIQYPQKQMINYLELIMKYRHISPQTKMAEWCWDRDAYDININTLFICSLFDFYEYYDQFERPYTDTDATIESEKKKASQLIEKNRQQMQETLEKVEEDKNNIQAEAEEKIKQISLEKENLLIVQGVKEIARSILKEELIDALPAVLASVAEYLGERERDMTLIDVEDAYDAGKEKQRLVAEKFLELGLSYFSKRIFNAIDESKVVDNDGYKQLKQSKTKKGLTESPDYKRRASEVIETINKSIS